jgi:hypothetical protein
LWEREKVRMVAGYERLLCIVLHITTPYTNAEIGKELNITPVCTKHRTTVRSWTRHVEGITRNRTRIIKKHQNAEGTGKTIEETSECARPEWVNRSPTRF